MYPTDQSFITSSKYNALLEYISGHVLGLMRQCSGLREYGGCESLTTILTVLDQLDDRIQSCDSPETNPNHVFHHAEALISAAGKLQVAYTELGSPILARSAAARGKRLRALLVFCSSSCIEHPSVI